MPLEGHLKAHAEQENDLTVTSVSFYGSANIFLKLYPWIYSLIFLERKRTILQSRVHLRSRS